MTYRHHAALIGTEYLLLFIDNDDALMMKVSVAIPIC